MLGGLVFSGKSLQPKFSKLNRYRALNGCSRLRLARSCLKHFENHPGWQRDGVFSLASLAQMMRLMAESPITAMGNAMDL